MPTWIEDISTSLSNLGGVAKLADIYREVKDVRKGPHPKSIEATIRGAIERNSSDSAAHVGKNDIFFSVHGLGAGIWGLRSFAQATPLANDIGLLPAGVIEPSRRQQTTYRILRDTELARKLKLLHKDRCQLCRVTLAVAGKTYSEAHHLIPLGAPHGGPDTPENIIVVCPNCHVQLDYFSIYLSREMITSTSGHSVGDASLRYHNTHVAVVNNTELLINAA
jgi:hypothetical protein